MRDGGYLKRGDWPWLASLLLIGCLTLGVFAFTAYRFTDGQGGVPLDDAWIHFQFARNLARGDGFSFNPGHPTSGSTAPLWTLLLAAAYLVGGEFPVAGQLLSGACFLAALAVTYALGKQLTGSRWAAWLAGAVVATNGRMVWAGLSALEVGLFATLSLLAIGSYLRDRATRHYRLRTAALFGLAALSRPEGYLLFALSLADFTWNSCRRPEKAAAGGHVLRITHYALRTRITLRRLPLLPVVLFAAIVLPYLVFALHTSGHLLPNTYHAKAVVNFRLNRDFLSMAARYLIRDNPLLLPFYVLGVGVLLFPALSGSTVQLSGSAEASTLSSAEVLAKVSPKGHASLLSLWSVGLPLVYAFLLAVLYQHGRYLIPLIPCNAVIGVVGLLEARRLLLRRGYRWAASLLAPLPPLVGEGRGGVGRGARRGLVALVSLIVVAGTCWRLPAMARLYARNVDNINEMQVALGHWVTEHTPPDATLGLNDIGAITYISGRPVMDLVGLITPEVLPLLRVPDRDTHLADFMAERDVQYVIIFPNWFPGLAARRDLLEPVHRVTLEHNTICGGQTMVVYRTHWHR